MLVSHFSTVTLALRHVTRQKFYHGYTQGRREGGGATGAFCPGPHSAYGSQKIDIL